MVYVILGKGFEEVEALAPCDILRRGGVEVRLAGIDSNEVESGHGVTVKADCLVDDVIIEKGDIVVFPGGVGPQLVPPRQLHLGPRLRAHGGMGAGLCQLRDPHR